MEAAALPAPEFIAKGGEFKVILRNRVEQESPAENKKTDEPEKPRSNNR